MYKYILLYKKGEFPLMGCLVYLRAPAATCHLNLKIVYYRKVLPLSDVNVLSAQVLALLRTLACS